MSGQIRLALVIHNHQPIGNFDGVFEEAFEDSYAPFLDVLEQFPSLAISLHTSGSLLEWLEEAKPEYIERVKDFCQRGQIEIIGGPYYEPILACIPRVDRYGQIRAYTDHLQSLFDTDVRGMWVPERVWEQGFTGDITRAGIEYTVLDDYHFQASGLRSDDLHGYYLTEDEGRLFKIFPGSERLRYTIPFQEPENTLDYLREIAHRNPHAVVTFGDDGEKFGTWPGTKQHVYEDGWLHRFFESLTQNQDWLKVSTLADAVDHVSPIGKVYLPDCSYREMTEWALSTDRQSELKRLVDAKNHEYDPHWPGLKSFLRGGFWRNFRAKYPESQEMYARMIQVSQEIQRLSLTSLNKHEQTTVDEAKQELYRGQCNCSYWHGAFGGLYLPHLRNAVYQHFIKADNLLESLKDHTSHWVAAETGDFDLDARKEVKLASERMIAYVAPSRGGHLYELDIRQTNHNLLATLNRRPEPYHEAVRQAGHDQAAEGHDHHEGGAQSIHDAVRFKQPDLHLKLQYDQWERKSLVDHFLQPGLSLEAFRQGSGLMSDFASGVYDATIHRDEEEVDVVMNRTSNLGPYPVTVSKTVTLSRQRSGALRINYELSDLPTNVPLHFGVEFNFAGLAAGAADRYYYDDDGQRLGQLETVHSLQSATRLGVVDEWLGLDACVDVSQAAGIWLYPIQTISQSEGGFEAVHQSSVVMPHWEFVADKDGCWNVEIVLSVNTSAAQARMLGEAAAAGESS